MKGRNLTVLEIQRYASKKAQPITNKVIHIENAKALTVFEICNMSILEPSQQEPKPEISRDTELKR